jgi:hypothetical protein
MEGIRIGDVTHFYNKISVAVLALTDSIEVGDTIHIFGRTTDLRQVVNSLQIEHQAVDQAGPDQEVALKVVRRVRKGDKVYRLVESE